MMETRIYYTIQSRPIQTTGPWSFEVQCLARGINLARHWDESQLNYIIPLVDLINKESEYAEYRLVKVIETIEVFHTPPAKATQLFLGAADDTP